MSGLVAHNLSGLFCCREAKDKTDGMATGDLDVEIRRSVWRMAKKPSYKGLVRKLCYEGSSTG